VSVSVSVSVFVSVSLSVSVCFCACVCAYVCIHVCICACACIYIYMRVCACTCVFKLACACVCVLEERAEPRCLCFWHAFVRACHSFTNLLGHACVRVMCTKMFVTDTHAHTYSCGVATVSRIDKIIGLFCKRDL